MPRHPRFIRTAFIILALWASASLLAQQIVVGEASLVHLVLEHADGSTETIHTTDEHPFHKLAEDNGLPNWMDAPGVVSADVQAGTWTRSDQLSVGDRLSTLNSSAVIRAIAFTDERVPVYNLSIPGSPTYFIGEHGVWVHNCFKIHPGKQGKHILGHRNYKKGNSYLTESPEHLFDTAPNAASFNFDKGQYTVTYDRVVGTWIPKNNHNIQLPTNKAKIVFANDGTYHIFPIAPNLVN